MLSEMVRADLASLRDNGFQPTDEEIVKLNDIALRIERGKETSPVNMPRVAHAGNVTLHEPTIGSMQWWYSHGKDSAESDSARFQTYVFSLAKAQDVEYLSKLTDVKEIQDEVRKWASGVSATESELWRALLYVRNDYMLDEDNKNVAIQEDEKFMDTLWMNVIACAGALSVAPKDLMTVTHSELIALLIQANLHARFPMKQSVAKDYILYRQVMRKIEDRGKVASVKAQKKKTKKEGKTNG